MKKIRIGIIGVGNMGSGHTRNFMAGKSPEFELAAIADTNPARLDWARENTPESTVKFSDAEEMLDSGLLDAALVAVPHYSHPKYAMECFKRGLHVMVEKPAGVYTKQVREMNEAAKSSNVVFGMMFNQRTDPVYRKMRELVQSGEYGDIRRTSWLITNWYRPQAYYDSGVWRATWAGEGGGVLLNQCPHNLDLWQWICGMPSLINANLHYGKWHDIEVEDDVTAYVEYPNGATGTFVTTTGETPGTNRFEISMSRGKIVAENDRLYVWKNEMDEPEFSRTNTGLFAQPETEFTEIVIDEKPEWHPGVINAFGGAILRGEPLLARGEEGINGLTISNAMHLSAWTGSPVRVEMEDGVPRIDEELFLSELQKRIAVSRLKMGTGVTGDIDQSF